MSVVHYSSVKHLKTGTITAKEKLHLLHVAGVKYYYLIRHATVSG